jgi:hypothetical protein
MLKLHYFLVEYAKFPFPHPVEHRSADTTDISEVEVGLLKKEWKANYVVRDDTLVQKLCHTLENILGDTLLAVGAENYLLAHFSPKIQFDERGGEDEDWATNPSEAQVCIRFSENSRSSFKAEQFGLTRGAESVIARQGVLRRCTNVFVGTWLTYIMIAP